MSMTKDDKIDALRDMVWGMDIPRPTTPEYVELHEKMQKILKYIDIELQAEEEEEIYMNIGDIVKLKHKITHTRFNIDPALKDKAGIVTNISIHGDAIALVQFGHTEIWVEVANLKVMA